MRISPLNASAILVFALVATPLTANAFGASPYRLSIGSGGASITPVAFGDLPASGARRRGGRKTRESKPSAPAEARKDVQGETAAQHKAYLKQYGF